MDLVKPRMDVGLFTNHIAAVLAFWQQDVGVPFDHILPLWRGQKQHRHDLLGSVLKINEVPEALPAIPRAGYRRLLIAREGLAAPVTLADPDGNAVTLVPPGTSGVTRIGLAVAARDPAALSRFYGEAMGLPPVPGVPGAFLAGDSVLLVEADAGAALDPPLEGPGWRYITLQVPKANAAYEGVLARGGRDGTAPQQFGTVARVAFVRDPDGNWIELSQRASITGSLEP